MSEVTVFVLYGQWEDGSFSEPDGVFATREDAEKWPKPAVPGIKWRIEEFTVRGERDHAAD